MNSFPGTGRNGRSATPLAKLVSRAIALLEGWEDPSSPQLASKNPGLLADFSFLKATNRSKPQVFAEWLGGWDSLARTVQNVMLNSSLTMVEFAAKLGKPLPEEYAQQMGQLTGLPIDKPLTNAHLHQARPSKSLPLYGSVPSSPSTSLDS